MQLVLLLLSLTTLSALTIQSSLPYNVYADSTSPGLYSDYYTDYGSIYNVPADYGSYSEQIGQADDYGYQSSADGTAYDYEPELEEIPSDPTPYESESSFGVATMYQPSEQGYTDYEPTSIYGEPDEELLNEDEYVSHSDYPDTNYEPHSTYGDLYDQDMTYYSDLESNTDKYYTPDYYAAYDANVGSPATYYNAYGSARPDQQAEDKSHFLVMDDEVAPRNEYEEWRLPHHEAYDYPDFEGYGNNGQDYLYNPTHPYGLPIDSHMYRPNEHGSHVFYDQAPTVELEDRESYLVPNSQKGRVTKRFDRYGKDQSSLAYVPHRNRQYANRVPAPADQQTVPYSGHAYAHREMKAWQNPKSGATYGSASDYKVNHEVVDTSPEAYGNLARDQARGSYDKYASAETGLNNEPRYDRQPDETVEEQRQASFEDQYSYSRPDVARKYENNDDSDLPLMKWKMPKKLTEKESYNDASYLKSGYDDDARKQWKIYNRQRDEENSDEDSLHDSDYKLKSGFFGEGKFIGYGAQAKGLKYEQVVSFHHGGSLDKHGKHKTRYGGYDTQGRVKQYGEETAGRKHAIEGLFKSLGESDGNENGPSRARLSRKNRHGSYDDESDGRKKIKGSSQTRHVRRRTRYDKRRSHKKRYGHKEEPEDRYKHY